MLSLMIILLLSYLAGSVPTAIIAGRILIKDDIRRHGSGNAGATNVYRVMGWKPALIVVLIDIGKGILAVLFIAAIRVDALFLEEALIQLLAGVCAIVGHIWTVFAGFRGGKGVGTAFGVLVSLMPVPAMLALIVWLILVLSTRIVSLGSITAAVIFPAALIVQRICWKHDIPLAYMIIALAMGILILFTHRSNIGRLVRGEENRFGSSKPGRGKEH